MKFDIQTFGCKVNTYDTSLLQKRLEKSGFLMASSEPLIHILNTCAVTKEASMEAVRSAKKIKSKNPNSVVVITGCSAQVDTNYFESLSDVDLVVANSHKGLLEDILKKYLNGDNVPRVYHSNIFRKEDLEEGGGIEAEHTRAFLKIQDGCNSFCTFCVIPFARGKSRSLSIPFLVDKINEFNAQGLSEVVLTGVHIGDYEWVNEEEKKFLLEDLVEELLLKTKIPRIRLSSLEPIELTPRLLDTYSDERMCPHFHMSIQSANTKVLKDMKRKYSAQDVEDALNRIYKKLTNAFVGMDVIAGFPGESDEEHQDTISRLKNTPWTRMHVFPYSERPGTKALQIEPKVPNHKLHFRAQELRELSLERYSQSALNQIGQQKKVMVLRSKARGAIALSRDYWPVDFDLSNKEAYIGQEMNVLVTGYDQSNTSRIEGYLKAQLI